MSSPPSWRPPPFSSRACSWREAEPTLKEWAGPGPGGEERGRLPPPPHPFRASAHLVTFLRPLYLNLPDFCSAEYSAPPDNEVFPICLVPVSPHPNVSTMREEALPIWLLLYPQPLTVPGTQKSCKSLALSVRPPHPHSPPPALAAGTGSLPAGTRPCCVQGQMCGSGSSRGGTVLAQRESVDTSQGLAFPTSSSSRAPSQEGTGSPGDAHRYPSLSRLTFLCVGHRGGESIGPLLSAELYAGRFSQLSVQG